MTTKGKQMGGIRSEDDIKQRCWVDEETDCWHWRAGRVGNGEPSLYFPAWGHNTTLGQALYFLRTGQRVPRGRIYHCTCTLAGCANPKHRKLGNRSTQMLVFARARSPMTRVRIAAAKRATSKLSEDDIAAIILSKDTLKALAARYRCCPDWIHQIKTGKARRPIALVPGASVFALGPS